ncbi:MAG: glycoside hydrolase family 43 protein [Streptosporangiaceae bacterium]
MSWRNPVLPGFYPDPSVCRVGDEYFLVASSFTWFPGVPIFRSTNLVDWTQIGNVLDRPSQLDLSGTTHWSSFGVFAPTIRYRDGRYYMITTVVGGQGATTFFVTTEDPAGPWSDPVAVAAPGIDPDMAWDDEGRCWVHYSGGAAIGRVRIDDVTGEVLEGPHEAWAGTGLQYPEAPHLFGRDGIWYLLIAEGGTERGHSVTVARAPAPVGPWEPCPANPILSHRSTDRPIQNTGHADLVQSPDGRWWMVLLGVRPRGVTPGFHVLGRETFLTAVHWVEGWPVVDEVVMGGGEATATAPWSGRDDFDEPSLHPRWITPRRSPTTVGSLRGGRLTLHGAERTLDSPDPVLVARRQQHHGCHVRALVDPDTSIEAGLTIYLDDGAHYDVSLREDQVVVRARCGPFDQVMATAPYAGGRVVLEIETVESSAASAASATAGAAGPDIVRLGGGGDVLAELDGRYLSTEAQGGFLGRVIGMYAVGGNASFDWFDYLEGHS